MRALLLLLPVVKQGARVRIPIKGESRKTQGEKVNDNTARYIVSAAPQ
jgi:hypothetical protein